MSHSAKSASRGSATLSASDIPPLSQSLPLEQITFENQRYTHSAELRRVLGVSLGNQSEGHYFEVDRLKHNLPLATEKLKKFKDNVHDTSRKARDRAKFWRRSIFKLDRYEEALSSTKRQRTDLSSNGRLGRSNIMKMGICNPHDHLPEKLDDKINSNGPELKKSLRTSMLDTRMNGRSANVTRQPVSVEKGIRMLKVGVSDAIHIEEKIPNLPAGGGGWEKKMKRKRSFGAAGSRVISGDRDIKQVTYVKPNMETKLQPIHAQSCRSRALSGMSGIDNSVNSLFPTKSSSSTLSSSDLEGVPHLRDGSTITEERIDAKGCNKTKICENNAGSPSRKVKSKLSGTQSTFSVTVLNSSPEVHYSSGADGDDEQATNTMKSPSSSVANSKSNTFSTSSSASNMAHLVGQKPPKILRTRKEDLVSSAYNNDKAQISSQGFGTSEFGTRPYPDTSGLLRVTDGMYNRKIKMESANFPSPPTLTKGEELGDGENKPKEGRTATSEALDIGNDKTGVSMLPTRVKQITGKEETEDSEGSQGKIRSNISPAKLLVAPSAEKIENLSAIKPLECVKRGSDKNRSKSGRPPTKKQMVRKPWNHVGHIVDSGSPDYAGELEDDHEELLVAATSAHNAKYRACSNSFWKKMEHYFASVTSEDESYLKHQLNFAEELLGSLYQVSEDEKNALGDLIRQGSHIYSDGRQESHASQEPNKADSTHEGFIMSEKFGKAPPLYQRILSALIEEDGSEEKNIQAEGRNNFQCASDDSHCDSCNYNDFEFEKRDRIKSKLNGFEPKEREKIEPEVESKPDQHAQKHGSLDVFSCNKSVSSNTDSNRSVSSSVCNNEQWQADDGLSYYGGVGPRIFNSELSSPHSMELNLCSIFSDCNYQQLPLDDRLMLELQSIGLCPETMPHLSEGEEEINKDISELQAELCKQVQKMKKIIGKILETIPSVKDAERRDMEEVAMSKLIEMAYKKKMASRGTNSSKRVIRRVSKKVALAFAERTLARCHKFEDTGKSCFGEPALQEIIFPSKPDLKASRNLDKQQLHETILNKGKKRALNDNGSASSKAVSVGSVKGKRSGRAKDQNIKMSTNNSASGSFGSVRKPKPKAKQRTSHLSASGDGVQNNCTKETHPYSSSAQASNLSTAIMGNVIKRKQELSKEEKEKEYENKRNLANFSSECTTALDKFEHEDYSSLLDFEVDGVQEDNDLLGLEIPMDDLSDVHMFM